MKRALAVVDESDVGTRLLKEAGMLAASTEASLIVLNVIDEEAYSAEVRRQANQASHDLDSISNIIEKSADSVQTLVNEVLSDLTVSYEIITSSGEPSEVVLSEADKHNCDHIFITGAEKSPTGKILFGDDAQSVLLNFEGPVTVYTH
ncbi:universal stress protein [Halalkalicoccus tibetensis]|uniref:Universal stress protein n=1 Tax=Halalkalicoccus tibetensis TaxID=175632 RepID=A0ABD5V8H8_9EURY